MQGSNRRRKHWRTTQLVSISFLFMCLFRSVPYMTSFASHLLLAMAELETEERNADMTYPSLVLPKRNENKEIKDSNRSWLYSNGKERQRENGEATLFFSFRCHAAMKRFATHDFSEVTRQQRLYFVLSFLDGRSFLRNHSR